MDRHLATIFENARLTPKLHHPATFLERGVALPLTTPLLAGARARPADQRLELIMLNPSGGRGVYILPWAGVSSFCRPTLHDSVFNQRIAALSHVTPQIIRRVARQVAVEGLAGEDASAAAGLATKSDKGDLILTNYQLLMALFQQTKGHAAPMDQTAQLRAAVDAVSQALGRSGEWTASALEELAEVMAPVGVGEGVATARVQQQVELLRRTQTSLSCWAVGRSDEALKEGGAMFHSVASVTLELAQMTLVTARALTADIAGLLGLWSGQPDSVRELAARPEWLLDGWERICTIWDIADDEPSREAALVEIAGLIPVMPREAAEWGSSAQEVIDREAARRRRIMPFNHDWLTGAAVYDLIARNEQLRAAGC